MTNASDRDEVLATVDTFFSAFVSGPDARRCEEILRSVMLPAAVVVRTCGDEPTTHGIEEFAAPRVELLASGALADFREWVTDARVDLFGDVAQVWCSYAKAWRQDGEEHRGAGMKSIQLVRTQGGWRISAVAWDDERAGLVVPAVVQPPGQ